MSIAAGDSIVKMYDVRKRARLNNQLQPFKRDSDMSMCVRREHAAQPGCHCFHVINPGRRKGVLPTAAQCAQNLLLGPAFTFE